jgi:hypothetical protein
MSVDELLPRARELKADGRVPSKNALRKTLGVAWEKASEVHRILTDETVAEALERSARRRERLTKLRPRKNPGRRLMLRPRVVPAAPVSPGVGPVAPQPIAEVSPVPVEVQPVQTQMFPASSRRVVSWPLLLLALPAFVAIWSGWVGLGGLTGFGVVHPLPGIADGVQLNTAITLPIGLETYAAYALYVWLSSGAVGRARLFAMWSAISSLALGAAGQVAYHLMAAAGQREAPWGITTTVACLPVAVVGMGAALYHLVHAGEGAVS